MTNEIEVAKQSLTITKLVNDTGFIEKTKKQLGEGAPQFLSSVLTLANSNPDLKNLDPIKLYNTCLMSAALKLPFNQNLGQAYIIAYKGEPQLQIGWKGFVQLAQRSGQFKTINVSDVRVGELKRRDRLTGEIDFEWLDDEERSELDVIGYVAFFELVNGFTKMLYMTNEELNRHAKAYSQTFKRGFGVWKDNFDAMAKKTVIKLLLSKYAPLSVDMGKAIEVDQSNDDGEYADNKRVEIIDAELGGVNV